MKDKDTKKQLNIEVCLAVWKRLDRLPKLIKQLEAQTNQNFWLNIWNNSGKEIQIKGFTRYSIVNSKTNVGSIGRFKLVPLTTGKCIIFIDDDLNLETDFIEYMYEAWKSNPDDIQGWFTRVFKSSYWDSIPYNLEDTEVDYVGTGGMVLSRDIFDEEKSLLNPPPEMIKVEDLWLSYIARQTGRKLYALEPHCSIEGDGKDQYKGLIEYKECAYQFLKDNKWLTINERR